jgi:hypothetical protein
MSTRGTLLRPLDAAITEYCENFTAIEESLSHHQRGDKRRNPGSIKPS